MGQLLDWSCGSWVIWVNDSGQVTWDGSVPIMGQYPWPIDPWLKAVAMGHRSWVMGQLLDGLCGSWVKWVSKLVRVTWSVPCDPSSPPMIKGSTAIGHGSWVTVAWWVRGHVGLGSQNVTYCQRLFHIDTFILAWDFKCLLICLLSFIFAPSVLPW